MTERTTSRDLEHANGLSCDFCGRHESQVGKLIAGDRVQICDRCVMRSIELIFLNEAERGNGTQLRKIKGLTCSFCHRLDERTQVMVGTDRDRICDGCLCGILRAVSADLRSDDRSPIFLPFGARTDLDLP